MHKQVTCTCVVQRHREEHSFPHPLVFFNIQIEHGNEKVTFETSMMDVAHSFHGCEIAGKLNKSNLLERKQQTPNIE